ncbi:hypothetical protein D3C84_1163060 [compost metagenome]
MGQVVVAAGPFEEFGADVQAMLARGGLDHADAFGEYFVADAVTGNCGDSESLAHEGRTRCLGNRCGSCYKGRIQR